MIASPNQNCGSLDLPAVLLVLGVQLVGLLCLLSHPARNQLLVVLCGLSKLLLQRRESNLQGVVLVLECLVRPLQVLRSNNAGKYWMLTWCWHTGSAHTQFPVKGPRLKTWDQLPSCSPKPDTPRRLILTDVCNHTACRICMPWCHILFDCEGFPPPSVHN